MLATLATATAKQKKATASSARAAHGAQEHTNKQAKNENERVRESERVWMRE